MEQLWHKSYGGFNTIEILPGLKEILGLVRCLQSEYMLFFGVVRRFGRQGVMYPAKNLY